MNSQLIVIILIAGVFASLLIYQAIQNNDNVVQIITMTCTEFEDYENNAWVQRIIDEKRDSCEQEEILELLRESQK